METSEGQESQGKWWALRVYVNNNEWCWHGREILPRPLQESIWEDEGLTEKEWRERNRVRDRRNWSMLTDAFLWPEVPWLRSPELKKLTWKIFSRHLGLLQPITNSSSDGGSWGWLAPSGNFSFVPNKLLVDMPGVVKDEQTKGWFYSPNIKDKDWQKIWWSCFKRKKKYMECHISQIFRQWT